MRSNAKNTSPIVEPERSNKGGSYMYFIFGILMIAIGVKLLFDGNKKD